MKCFRAVFASVLFALASSAFAQDSGGMISVQVPDGPLVLTVDQAVEYALEGNLNLRQSAATVYYKEKASHYAWNSVSPSIGVNAGISQVLAEDAKPTYSLGGSLSVRFTPALFSSIKRAAQEYEKEQLSYEDAVRSVELNVRKLFYSILLEEENIVLLESAVNMAKTQYSANLTKFNHGTLSQLDVLNSQVNMQDAELSLESAKVTLENDMASFKQVLGLPGNTELNLSGSMDSFLGIGEISLDGLEISPSSVASIEKQIELAQTQLLATKFTAWGPSLSAGYSYSLNGRFGDEVTSNNGGTLSLSVSIPLDGFLPWSSGAQSIETQKATIEILEMQLENARISSDIEISKCMNKIKSARDSLKLMQQRIDVAQKTYDMTQQAYNRGTRDILVLQNASSSLQQSKLRLKSDILTLVSAILDLENAAGLPFGTLLK